MKIKMKVKDSKNLKNKIGLKNLFVSKKSKNNNPNIINIQTINIEKNPNYFKEDKNYFSTKNLNNIRYLNNSSLNYYNIVTKNDYFLKKNRNSFFNSFESEQSPINSEESSSYISSGKKRYKKRRYHKKFKIMNNKIKNEYIYDNNNSNISIHNLSFNTNNTNNSNNSNNINIKNNIGYIYSSSSSEDDINENNNYNYTDTSEDSYKSRDNKRRKYLDKMMVEENELDYLKKSEVGLNTSEDEDNNNSIDNNNNNSIEENFNNEIERILIEIYNKNISLISSGNINEINKNNGDIEDIEKQIKKYLKRENFKTNLLVLKSLSNKIKELVGKYKEKVFEIEELKTINNTLQGQIILNEQIIRSNNSLESNVATNSNSNASYNSYYEEENLIKNNNLILNPQEEINKKGIAYILLRELINIKRTLKISSKEIEGIFKYPLSILKNENGKKIKFSIELMQREEFCKTLLNDDLISALLSQIKDIFSRYKYQKITKWILELEENYQHKNEMTRFVKYINDRLPSNNNINNENKNNNQKNYLEDIIYNEDKIKDNEYNSTTQENNTYNEESTKKVKKKKNKKMKNNEIEKKRDELEFKDIDEILNYINDDTDSKKGKKKCKKGKKNKNKFIKKEEEKENKEVKNDNNNNKNDNTEESNNFDIEFEKFKEEIRQNSIYIYEINCKIKPCLSENFLNNIYNNYQN